MVSFYSPLLVVLSNASVDVIIHVDINCGSISIGVNRTCATYDRLHEVNRSASVNVSISVNMNVSIRVSINASTDVK